MCTEEIYFNNAGHNIKLKENGATLQFSFSNGVTLGFSTVYSVQFSLFHSSCSVNCLYIFSSTILISVNATLIPA